MASDPRIRASDADRDRTAALLRVHTSNYRITGFTEAVSLEELSKLARARDLPLPGRFIHD